MDKTQLLNDKPAIFHYDSSTKSLKWFTDGHSNVEISAADIIAATQERLLYVDSSSSDSNDESPPKTPIVKSVEAQGLPEAFVKQYQLSPYVSQRYPLHIVVSVASGTGLAKDFHNSTLSPLLDFLGYADAKIYHTESEDTITQLTERVFLPAANAGEKQWIVLLSGDGGVVDIVNAMLSQHHFTENYTKPRLSVLPLGTGNALANSLKTNQDNTLGLAAMTRGDLGPLPLFKATFSPGARLLSDEARKENELFIDPATGKPVFWGAVVCSWGLHATLVGDSDTAEYRQYGVERFKMAAKASLFPDDGSNPHPYCGRVSVMRKGSNAWQELARKDHAYVLATFVSNLEKTFAISPSSKPLDGQLRLIHFGPMSGNEVMKIMMAGYDNGKHVEDARVSYEEIEGLKIHFDEDEGHWRRVCVDGKIIRVEKGGFVEVTKEARDIVDIFHM